LLVVLSGLPGVGKTTVARDLAVASGAVHLRIDSIEQALRNAAGRSKPKATLSRMRSPRTTSGSA